MRASEIIAKAEQFRKEARAAEAGVDVLASFLGYNELEKAKLMDDHVHPTHKGLCDFLQQFPEPVPHEYKKAVKAAWEIYWEIDKIFE